MKRWSWVLLGVVVVVALAIGARTHKATSLDTQVEQVANSIRCPVCAGESVADSQAPVAKTMRDDIRARLEKGESPEAIRAYFVAKFGEDIRLDPKTSGISLAAWLLPVVLAVFAGLILYGAISRWRARPIVAASADELARVEQELRNG